MRSKHIDIPSVENIRKVAVCKQTGRIALATKKTITVWACTPTTIEFVYRVKVDFELEKIDIFENHLMYCSACEVRVVRIEVDKIDISSFYSLFLHFSSHFHFE